MRERDLKALEFDKLVAIVTSFAISEPGRRRAAALRPATDPATVRHRLRAAAELLELRSRAGALPLDDFVDQRELMLAVAPENAVLGGDALVRIRDFVIAARTAEAFLRSRVEHLPILAALVRNLLAPKELADALLRALADDGALVDDASPELKRLRTRLRDQRLDLETRLARSLNAGGMEPFVSDYLVTIRNRRFVLPLKPNYAERLDGIVQDRSVSGETLFVEPMWAVELNNRLMLTEREAAAEEYRLLMRLSAMVRGYSAELELTFDALTEVDALNARAIFAERFKCVEPELGNDIYIDEARHPLLVATGRAVVPIDLRIGAGQHGLVISGPNTGGKTVALKTLGLLSIMAQAGLLIPAAPGARLKLFSSIFADIGDEQSIAASLSSFAAHIVNLTDIVRSLDEPALVILDEPGAGTDPAEGAALAIAVIDYLAARDCLVAVATHSTAVKLHAYSRAGFDAAAVDFDPGRLTPLYRLKPHTIGQSYGLAVAERLGLPAMIVDAARAAMPAGAAELADSLERLERERAELRADRDRVATREGALIDQEREQRAAFHRERERLTSVRTALRESGDRILEDLRSEGAAVMAELRAQSKTRHDLARTIASARSRLDEIAPPEAAPSTEPSAPLRAGDQVEIGNLRGELIAIEPGKAIFGRGGLRIEVAPERLRRVAPVPAAPEPTVALASRRESAAELNLIGERTADALRRLEDFLDQAYLTNQPEVRVIHGIGSGALRKAVHDYLANSPYAASFRQAESYNGGAGATVVTLSQ